MTYDIVLAELSTASRQFRISIPSRATTRGMVTHAGTEVISLTDRPW